MNNTKVYIRLLLYENYDKRDLDAHFLLFVEKPKFKMMILGADNVDCTQSVPRIQGNQKSVRKWKKKSYSYLQHSAGLHH